jgi:pimeloyl-ACP methyl ester carboxylesterase
VITGASVGDAVFPLLYKEARGWPAIVGILARADAGSYADLLPAFALDGGATVTVPNAFAIVCDDSATRRLGLDYLPAQVGNQAIYPRFGGANFGLAISFCSAWPPTRVAPVENLETRNPIVLIGNDFDPATPMAWSRNMATALGAKATLVRYKGGGHTVYLHGSACIDGAIDAYFRDLTVPPNGLTCPAQPLSFASSHGAAGVTMADILSQVMPKLPRLPHRR